MNLAALIPATTAILAAIFAVALVDQWLQRRRTYQLIWAIGMAFFAIASATEAVAASAGWSDGLVRVWYLSGGVLAAGWLGLGTVFLLARTRFGYGYALCVVAAGMITMAASSKFPDGATLGAAPLIYALLGVALALVAGVETYFQNGRWARLAGLVVVAATIVGVVLIVTASFAPAGVVLDPRTKVPLPASFPSSLRMLSTFMNVSGGFALILGALFSTYVFMPKRRPLGYSLEAGQQGDQFLFNIVLGLIAVPVNFVVSVPGALRALVRGELNSRVPATLLIAIGAFVISGADSLAGLGDTTYFQLGKLIGVVLIFAGFLVSIEVFREIRVPFTGIVLRAARHEPAEAGPQH